MERVCSTPEVLRTKELGDADVRTIKIEFVAAAIESLVEGAMSRPQIEKSARDYLDRVGFIRRAEDGTIVRDDAKIDEAIEAFRKTDEGTPFKLTVYESFVEALDPWIHLKSGAHLDCRSRDGVPKPPPPSDDPAHCKIHTDWSPEKRLAWAAEQIDRQRKADRDQRRQPEPRRYVPGRQYENLQFVMHPYYGFTNQGIWATEDGSLYWIDERAMSLSALTEAAAKAQRVVTGLLIVTTVMTGVALLAPAAAVSLPTAFKSFTTWVICNPDKSIPLLFTGVELVLTAAGENIPPTGPAEEFVFVLNAGRKSATRLVVQAEEALVPTARRTFKVIQSEWITPAIAGEIRQAKGVVYKTVNLAAPWEWTAPAVSKAVGTAMSAGGAAIQDVATSPLTQAELGLLSARMLAFGQRVMRTRRNAMRAFAALPQAADDSLIKRAIANFGHVAGVEQHILNAFSRREDTRRAARFSLRAALYALKTYEKDNPRAAMAFEYWASVGETRLAGGRVLPGIRRRIDFWLVGRWIEIKSVARLDIRFAVGKVGAGQSEVFGELERDLFMQMPKASTESLEILKRTRWIFDETHMFGRTLSEVERDIARHNIADRLYQNLIREHRLFEGWPRLDELREAIKEMIVLI